jgi:hypothetical protein
MESEGSGDADLNRQCTAIEPAFLHNRIQAIACVGAEPPEMIWRGNGLRQRNAAGTARCDAANIDQEPHCAEMMVSRIKSA